MAAAAIRARPRKPYDGRMKDSTEIRQLADAESRCNSLTREKMAQLRSR